MESLALKCTAIGSLPHRDAKSAVSMIFDTLGDIPFWPQLASVDRHEDMTVQYLQGIPGIKFDESQRKIYYDSQSDEFFLELEEFFMDYEAIVNDKDFSSLEKYGITAPYSSSLPLFFDSLSKNNCDYAKGQIIGPFTLGTSICDSEGVCAFYDETYREVLVKGLTLKAIWQIEQIKKFSQNPNIKPIIFMDEPVMSQYGTSAFITVQKEDIISAFSEISNAIKNFGAFSAVHCCGKTNWSILIDSGVDIINFDAYFFTKSLGAYASNVFDFIKKGGYIAWGLVPTLDKDALAKTNITMLEKKFEEAIEDLVNKGIEKNLLLKHSFFTPSCGAGSLDMDLAQKAMNLVSELSSHFQQKYSDILKEV